MMILLELIFFSTASSNSSTRQSAQEYIREITTGYTIKARRSRIVHTLPKNVWRQNDGLQVERLGYPGRQRKQRGCCGGGRPSYSNNIVVVPSPGIHTFPQREGALHVPVFSGAYWPLSWRVQVLDREASPKRNYLILHFMPLPDRRTDLLYVQWTGIDCKLPNDNDRDESVPARTREWLSCAVILF